MAKNNKKETQKVLEMIEDVGEVEVIKTGEEVEAVITRISKGMLSDFIPADSLKGDDETAIKIETDTGASLVMSLPEGKVHPKRKLAKFIETYGSTPKVNMKVRTYIDKEGFSRVVIRD
jgi:hypothetical protein